MPLFRPISNVPDSSEAFAEFDLHLQDLREKNYGDLSRAEQAAIDDADDIAHQEHAGRLFNKPARTTRMANVVGKAYLSPLVANAKVDLWHAVVAGQNKSENGSRTILSLFDTTGNWSQPWVRAGYNVIQMDIQNGVDINALSIDALADAGIDDVYGILAACPCTDFSNSGARWWTQKDEAGITAQSIELVQQTLRLVEYLQPAFWVIENPNGRIQKLNNLPDWRLSFDPHHFGDPYTKRTVLFGHFNQDLPTANVDPVEGSRIHKLSGQGNGKHERSVTPLGFAYAFFMANHPGAMQSLQDLHSRQDFNSALKQANAEVAETTNAWDGASEGDNEGSAEMPAMTS